MAKENRRITVSELDFDQIKNNLKTYLRGQSEFSDYDFEGSGLSVLIDILSLNTHYNALYNNMSINELFLDTATKRSSVVSRANELGYTPRSASCSQATINLTVSNTTTPTPPSAITLPKYTPFSTNISNGGFTFYTVEDLTVLNNGTGVYNFNNVLIKEGTPLTYKFTVATGARYIIPNNNVDLNTLTVKVQDSVSSSNYVAYTKSDTILNITGTDKVYFIKEIDNQLYELTFGDGIIGNQLSNGNIVHIEYMVSSLDTPNGARAFIYSGDSIYGGTVSITTVGIAYNGADVENIESIKYNAPKTYTAQNRAITSGDYKALIHDYFPEARAISVWGGETTTPPQYGKVFISIVPQTLRSLTDGEKKYVLEEILYPRKSLSIMPEIVDPVFTRVQLDVSFYYNPQLTTRTAGDLTTLVKQAIRDYNDETLSLFGSVFKYSHLSRMMDECEESITSNITTVKIRQTVVPTFNIASPYVFNIDNPIYNSGVPEESIMTTGFYISSSDKVHFIDDLPTEDSPIGKLRLFYYNSSGQKVIVSTIGTVDYTTGLISVNALNVTGVIGDTAEIIVKLQSNDIVSSKNHFVQIDETILTVTPIVDSPNKTYTFTSSRN